MSAGVRRLPTTEATVALTQGALHSTSVEGFLRTVVVHGYRALPEPLPCTVTVCGAGRPPVTKGSDAVAVPVEQAQFASGDGPGPHALRTGRVLHIADLEHDHRWPGFRAHATGAGLFAVLSLPLPPTGPLTGVLSYYAPEPHDFAMDEILAAEHFAAHTAGTTALAARLIDLGSTVEQLTSALASRAVIDQAIGILMARSGCGTAEAFGYLRRESQHQNIKLREVAAMLVTHVGDEPATHGRQSGPAPG